MVYYYDVRLNGVSIDNPQPSIQSARIKAYNHLKANPTHKLELCKLSVVKGICSEPTPLELIFVQKNNRVVKGPYSSENVAPTHIVHSDGTLKVH